MHLKAFIVGSFILISSIFMNYAEAASGRKHVKSFVPNDLVILNNTGLVKSQPPEENVLDKFRQSLQRDKTGSRENLLKFINEYDCEVIETSNKDISFGYARGRPVSISCPQSNISLPLFSSVRCLNYCIDVKNNRKMKRVVSVPVFTGLLLEDKYNDSIKPLELPAACVCEPRSINKKCKSKNSSKKN